MNKKYIYFIVIAVLIVLGIYFYTNTGKTAETEITEIPDEQTVETPTSERLPLNYEIEELINEFFTYLVASAPPTSDVTAHESAKNLFTEEAQASLGGEDFNLALVLGIQDLPDMGYEIESIALNEAEPVTEPTEIEDTEEGMISPDDTEATDMPADQLIESADVTVIMKYSGGDTTRIFKVVNVDGTWKISDVE